MFTRAIELKMSPRRYVNYASIPFLFEPGEDGAKKLYFSR